MPIGPEHVADLVAIHWDPWVAEWYAGEWPTARAEAFAQGCARGWSVDGVARNVMESLGMRWAGEIMSRGLIAGRSGAHDNAPFALYAVGRGGDGDGGPGGRGSFGAHVGGQAVEAGGKGGQVGLGESGSEPGVEGERGLP